MAKRPARSKPKKPTSAFLQALQFAALATLDKGPPNTTHLLLVNGVVVGNNNTVAIGVSILEDLTISPNAEIFLNALTKCDNEYALTQLETGHIVVKSDKFRAVVPCLPAGMLAMPQPDPPRAIIDNRFRDALGVAGVLANESGAHVYLASVLLNGRSIVGTDGQLVLEAWHGHDLPSGLVLSKANVDVICKTTKNLTRFGFTPDKSITLYFDDNSWLKAQLYNNKWPNLAPVFEIPTNPWPIPPGFFTALDAVAGFSESGNVYFAAQAMHSHANDLAGASYELTGLPDGSIFNAKRLKIIQPLIKSIDFVADNGNKCFFFGDNVRGVLVRGAA